MRLLVLATGNTSTLATFSSGAAGWGGVVLHGTPEVMARRSVRMSRRIAWARQAMRERIPTDKSHRQVTNEGRDPKTLPRPSQCEANVVPEFSADSQRMKCGIMTVLQGVRLDVSAGAPMLVKGL